MKEFNDQLLKFKITKDKLKMEISLKDLEILFASSPSNYDGEQEIAKVKRGRRQDFAEYIVNMLMDNAPNERDCIRWGEPFEDIFEEITEGDEDFCKYTGYDDED